MRPNRPLAAAFALAAGLFAAAIPAAAQTGMSHLVFEKSAKMKKIAATLYLPLDAGGIGADQSLVCGVIARGKKGAIPVAGTLSLRLNGDSAGGTSVWRSDPVAAGVDDLGNVRFASEEIDGLAASAPGDAEIRLLEVGFRGGRGGRATELTLDCLPEDD